jgi:PadR family transcriptional regulator
MNKPGFSLSPGTLYPAFHALLHEGDVTVRRRMAGGKIRKCYRLTAKGRRELEEIK